MYSVVALLGLIDEKDTLRCCGIGKDVSRWGDTYVDDGISFPPGPSARLVITAGKNRKMGGRVDIKKSGKFSIEQPVTWVMILGVSKKPGQVSVSVGGKKVVSPKVSFDADKEEVVVELGGEKGVRVEGGLMVEWVVRGVVEEVWGT
ncbi:hypothetical protein M422DRAFT_41690 [Sphaerobolus stellatus SS14]|nr:hypothetical protein M422DRAFT_41690 [Sphaerobolus stellatus SS14]